MAELIRLANLNIDPSLRIESRDGELEAQGWRRELAACNSTLFPSRETGLPPSATYRTHLRYEVQLGLLIDPRTTPTSVLRESVEREAQQHGFRLADLNELAEYLLRFGRQVNRFPVHGFGSVERATMGGYDRVPVATEDTLRSVMLTTGWRGMVVLVARDVTPISALGEATPLSSSRS